MRTKCFLVYPWDGFVTQDELATGALHANGVIATRWYTNEDYATGGFRDVLHWNNFIACPLVNLGNCNPSCKANALAWQLFPGRSFQKKKNTMTRTTRALNGLTPTRGCSTTLVTTRSPITCPDWTGFRLSRSLSTSSVAKGGNSLATEFSSSRTFLFDQILRRARCAGRLA